MLKKGIQSSKTIVQSTSGGQIGRSELDQRTWIREIRVIENVKRIGPELKLQAFPDRKLTAQGKVNLCKTEARYVIASFGALPNGIRERKRVWI